MSTDLYTEFYGFSERPFTLLPDPDFLYWSKAHRRAFLVLEYGIATRAPLTVVTGEIGTGKTTLVQKMLTGLPDNVVVGLISNAQGGRGDLLRWVLNALDIPYKAGADYVSIFQTFQDFLIHEYASGRHVLLVIDEAQNLSVEALEELRMLTNINANKDELLQLILVGQPELRDLIRRPELKQFVQRITATYHLQPMSVETTGAYITHRLRHVGGAGEEFTPAAIARIFAQTRGVPRLVNKLCDLAMVYAASDALPEVTVDVVDEVLADGLFISTEPEVAENPLLLTDRLPAAGKAAE